VEAGLMKKIMLSVGNDLLYNGINEENHVVSGQRPLI